MSAGSCNFKISCAVRYKNVFGVRNADLLPTLAAQLPRYSFVGLSVDLHNVNRTSTRIIRHQVLRNTLQETTIRYFCGKPFPAE